MARAEPQYLAAIEPTQLDSHRPSTTHFDFAIEELTTSMEGLGACLPHILPLLRSSSSHSHYLH